MTRSEEISRKYRQLGLNVVGVRAKKYANYTMYTLFLKEERDNNTLLDIARKGELNLTHQFVESGHTYKHGANKIIKVNEAN